MPRDGASEPAIAMTSTVHTSPCQACGACCAYAADWPRFWTDSDAAIAAIPERYVDPSGNGMRWTGERCAALEGRVGVVTACAVYSVRPDVCRACEPGDDACRMARERHALPPLPPMEA